MAGTRPSQQQIKARGRFARKRAQDRAVARSGSSRITELDWYPEIEALQDEGWTNPEIAAALNLGARRIQQIRAAGRMNWSGQFASPDTKRELDPEYQEMMEFSAEGFKKFFEFFSGYTLSDFGFEMVQEFIATYNLMVNVPPRHAKSFIMAVWVPIWLLCRNRNEQIIVVSKTNHLAVTHCRTIAFELEFNVEMIRTFGRFAPERAGEVPWKPSRGELLILGRTKEAKSGQLSILARGAGQQILGTEATVIILDDATDRKTSESPTEGDRHWQWIQEEVFSRLQPPEEGSASGRVCVVGQRVHLNDIYGRLAKMEGVKGKRKGKKLWKVIKYPAVIRWPDEDPRNPDPQVLWPEQWSYDDLMEVYDRVGHDAFERMYQQNPLPEGSSFVRPEWWERCRDYDRAGYKGIRNPDDPYLPIARVASIDPSPTKENGLVVADVVSLRDMFACSLIEMKKWEGGSRELVAEIDRCITEYQLDYVILESSTMTKWFEKEPVYERLKLRVTFLEHHTGKNKGDELLGVESLSADIEAGRIRLPYGDIAGRVMSNQFENEGNLYGHGFPDDLLMAMWFIKWNWKKLRPKIKKTARASVNQAYGYIRRAHAKKGEDAKVAAWRKAHGRAR